MALTSARVPWKSLENQIALLTSMAMRSEDMERDLVDVNEAKQRIEALVVELQDELQHAAGVAQHATDAHDKAVNALREEEAHVERLRQDLQAAHLQGSKQEEEALLALRHAEQYVSELRAQQEQALRGLHVAQQQLKESQEMVERSKAERAALLKDLKEMEARYKAMVAVKAELEAQIAEQQRELDKGASWRELHTKRFNDLQREKEGLAADRTQLERDMEALRAELFRTQAEREALLKDMKLSEEAWEKLRAKHGIEMEDAEARRQRSMMHHVVVALQNKQLTRGLMSWRRWLWAKTRFESLVRATWTRWSQRHLFGAYRYWQDLMLQLRADRALVRRTCLHWAQLQVHYAWNTWLDSHQWRKMAVVLVRRSLLRIANRQLWLGWNQWREEFGWAAGRHQHLLQRAVGRMLHRELSRGWLAWRSSFVSKRNIDFMLRRTAKRMLRAEEARAWSTWRQRYLKYHRLHTIASSAVRRLLHYGLAVGFTSLKQHAREERLRALHATSKAGARFKVSTSYRHWSHRLELRAYNTWRNLYLQAAWDKARLAGTWSKFSNRELNRAFNQWQSEYALVSYHRRILSYTASRLLHGDLARGFASLRLHARRERIAQEYELAHRQDVFIGHLSTAHAIARWTNRLLTQAWSSWRTWSIKSRQLRRTVHWTGRHVLHRQTARALNQWLAVHHKSLAKRKFKQIISWVTAHFAMREQARSFNAWTSWYHSKLRIETILRHTAGAWSNILCTRAYNKWYSEYATARELQRITRWIAGHWYRREIAISFDQWHTDCLAWRALHPLKADRKQLRSKVQYYITEEGKLKQKHAELEQGLAEEVAQHAATSETLGNKITGLERNLSEQERMALLAETHKKELKHRVLELEDRLAEVRAQWDASEAELSRQLEELVKERSAAHRAHSELEHLDGQCATLEEQLEAKQAEIDALKLKHEAEARELNKRLVYLEQELADHKAMIERHGLGRNADAQRFREEISLLADKLQAAEAEMYRANKEKQAAMVDWQRERHGLEAQLAAAEAALKNAADEKDRARRDVQSLERELAEERDANQELVGRLNGYAREMAERDREHSVRRAAELRDAEAGIHKAMLDSEDAAMRLETVEAQLRAQLAAAQDSVRRAEMERDEEKARSQEEAGKYQEAARRLEERLHAASRDAADAADRFSRERDNDRRLLQELEAQMMSTIRDREREAEGATARLDRVREEMAGVEARLEEERNRTKAEEAKRHEAEREAQHMQDELLSPRRLDPVRAAEERLALCMSERDEMRFKLDDEMRRLELKLREQQARVEQVQADARRAEDSHNAKVDALRSELQASEERARKAELLVDQAEGAKHNAMLEARGNDLRRAEIGSVLDAQRAEMESLRTRLSQLEGVRHEEALQAESKLRELQSEMRTVENAAADEIRRLDAELSSTQQAKRDAEAALAKDASVRQQELNLRVQAVEREREEERRAAQAEVQRLTEELRAAEAHFERLSREMAAAADRALRQHDGDRREVGDLLGRIKSLQGEKELAEADAYRKVNELAETLALAKAEIRRLDMELRSTMKPMIYV